MVTVLLVGPRRQAVGGVTSHLNLLLDSNLAQQYAIVHFAVGGEGLGETLPRKLWRVLAAPAAFAATLRRTGAALVHLNPSMDRSFWRDLALLVVARAIRLPVIFQIHGGQLPEHFCAHVPGARRVVRAALRLADQVVVLAKVEFAAFGRFLDAGKLTLIPNAIDTSAYEGPKVRPYDGQRPLRAIYIGRLVRSKGLFDACEAVGMALAAGSRVEFAIAGSGPDGEALQAHIEALGLAHAIRLVGTLHGSEKSNFLLTGDVFLFPTFHPEGLPYALLEAMAAGTPAITTTVGAIPDLITHQVDGLLVEGSNPGASASALRTLAAEPARLHALARAARERIAQAYSQDRMERDFAALYARTLDAAGPGPRTSQQEAGRPAA